MRRKLNKIPKLHIKKGDNVQVMAGEHKGKTGQVLDVISSDMRVIVEGVNIVKRHTKPSAKSPDGGIIEKEASIHISNVMLIDPKDGIPTKVGRKLDDNGKLTRYAKKSGEVLK